ncbi:MAG TPA: hypothetical protein VKH44_05580 [Pirellulaceae bacterium]|nr:hypothetical protein [Pirellulaceae bacterium]
MTSDQKDDLRRKKLRFDELSPDEQQHLRDLHTSITSDLNAKELLETVKSYNRWLANLDSSERSTLLDIKDPEQRIARIKELMQQQEERRFRTYASNLTEDDRKAIYKWLGEWALAHAGEIREQSPRDARQRIDDAPDDETRQRALIDAWQRSRQQVAPAAADYSELLKRFSPETQKTIESSAASRLASEQEANRTPERQHELQQERLQNIVRIARYSRFFPVTSQDELLKYYAAMKSDDDRRKQLDGKEGEELRRELQRMYNWEHGVGRGGGPPGPPGGRGFGPGPGGWPGPPGGPRGDGRGRPDDRGKPGDRFDGGGKSPPPGDRFPPRDAKPAQPESSQP